MKLSQLRPCDKCGKKIAPAFYVIRFSQALFTPAAKQTLGMMQYLGGNLELGELFAPESDEAVLVLSDKDKHLEVELFICQPCFYGGPLDLASLWEKQNDRIEAAQEKQEEEKKKHEAELKGENLE